MKSNVSETNNSDAIKVESDSMNAVTNVMTVNGANIDNIDLGLQTRDVFDLQVSKYISKVTVTTSKGTKTYEYDNEEIAKVDIHSKQLNGAKVDLEYTIKVENVGDIEGYAEQIRDYVPSDVSFDDAKNKDWYKGTDGSVYVKDSNKTVLKAGESKEYKLYLSKVMNENNTGILSNKVDIVTKANSNVEKEEKENNTSVQNTIITVSTGATAKVILVVIVIVSIGIGLRYGKVIIAKFDGGKVYKSKEKKKKINFKKNFK
jgi:type IV secretory pathway VirB2 component (pilin)